MPQQFASRTGEKFSLFRSCKKLFTFYFISWNIFKYVFIAFVLYLSKINKL